MSEPVVVAVVGAGAWGRNLVREFAALRGARLAWVCDTSEAARADVAAAHPSARTTGALGDVLADRTVRGVVIATDPTSHYELARAALEGDKDVLVEKPLALDSGHAEALAALADRRGRVLMVGHLLLYHPATRTLRQLVEGRDLGALREVRAERRNVGSPRDPRDACAWWTLAPHDVSFASHLFGAGPVAISARRAHDGDVDASLAYSGGRTATVRVGWGAATKARRLVVVGARKVAIFDDTAPRAKLTLYEAHRDTSDASMPFAHGDGWTPPVLAHTPLERECHAFIDAIQTRTPPLASGREGAAVVRVLEAGAASMAEDGARVGIARARESTHDVRAHSSVGHHR